MNIKYITGLSIIVGIILTVPVYGLESYTLPTGRTLDNPHIVGRNPIGIEVAHDSGVTFIKYIDLPKDMQKKLNYSASQESSYRKNLSAKRKQAAKVRNAKAEAEATEQRKRELVILERAQVRLADKIAATKLRIQFLQVEIPKLEKKKSQTMDASTGLAARSSDIGGGGYSSYYGNRYSSGNRSGRSERTKRQTINALNSEYQEAKTDLNMSKQSLTNKKFELIKMERLYKKHAEEIKQKKAALSGSKPSKSKSFISGVTSLFD